MDDGGYFKKWTDMLIEHNELLHEHISSLMDIQHDSEQRITNVNQMIADLCECVKRLTEEHHRMFEVYNRYIEQSNERLKHVIEMQREIDDLRKEDKRKDIEHQRQVRELHEILRNAVAGHGVKIENNI